MDAKEAAYKIAYALQKKLSKHIVGVRIEELTEGVNLFEFTLSEGGNAISTTAYSQSYFESEDSKHFNWLATTIYTELTQRYEWATKGTKK